MPAWTLPPHEETTTLSVRIPKSLRKRLETSAKARRRTLTQVCIFLLDAGLTELEKAEEHSRPTPLGGDEPQQPRGRPPKK